MTARPGQEASNAELLQRVERLEAEVRRITGILAGGEGSTPASTDASAWISYLGR